MLSSYLNNNKNLNLFFQIPFSPTILLFLSFNLYYFFASWDPNHLMASIKILCTWQEFSVGLSKNTRSREKNMLENKTLLLMFEAKDERPQDPNGRDKIMKKEGQSSTKCGNYKISKRKIKNPKRQTQRKRNPKLRYWNTSVEEVGTNDPETLERGRLLTAFLGAWPRSCTDDEKG